VVGGLVFSTVFTLLVTPVFYILITRVADRLGFKTVPPKEDLTPDEKGEGGVV
jgi:hypothetical protein